MYQYTAAAAQTPAANGRTFRMVGYSVLGTSPISLVYAASAVDAIASTRAEEALALPFALPPLLRAFAPVEAFLFLVGIVSTRKCGTHPYLPVPRQPTPWNGNMCHLKLQPDVGGTATTTTSAVRPRLARTLIVLKSRFCAGIGWNASLGASRRADPSSCSKSTTPCLGALQPSWARERADI